MFRPLSVFIGLRYTRAKKRNHFISFMSLISMLGIALGVMVLITVLSVMNGFDEQIKSRILNMVPQVMVSGWNGTVAEDAQVDAKPLNEYLKALPEVEAVAPIIEGQAMLSNNGVTAFALLNGVAPSLQKKVSPIGHKLISGALSDLKPDHFGIVLGKDLAARLGVTVGDVVNVMVPKANVTPFGVMPVVRQFTVVGIFEVGYQFDSNYALIHIADAQRLFRLPNSYSAWQLKLQDLYQAPALAWQLNQTLSDYQALDWTQQNENFFKALKMEKLMMFLILVLIIAVAAFNMLSSLVMVVTDKKAEIAILRTIGFSTTRLMTIFMVQGMVIGTVGTLLGLAGGLLLAENITALVNHIQHWFGVQFLSASVYYISFLPSKVNGSDVGHIIYISLLLSFLATLYPSWRATRVQPVEALRYE